MSPVFMEPLRNKPKCRVELHVHLDGSLRHETIWEVMRQKGLKLPGSGSLEDLKEATRVHEGVDLSNFLKRFGVYMPALMGDLTLLERIAYEFVEDKARDSVAYCEARFCPHLLIPEHKENGVGVVSGSEEHSENGVVNGEGDLKSDDFLEAVLKGLKRGEEEFGTKVRVILCCIQGFSQWAWDILRLCEEYRDRGVVGIDYAGNECNKAEAMDEPIIIEVFKAAKEKGIHRTVHAGEAGPANSVQAAIETLGAERIGHGYRVIEDETIYSMCQKEDIHFEVCPHSSYQTGSMKSLNTGSVRHPVLKFAEDLVSFSINTDDPTVTHTTLSDEYRLLSEWGFTEAQFTRSNFQAALHSFLNPEEKKELIDQLQETYGIISYTLPATPSSSSNSTSSTVPTPLKPSISFGTWAERA